MTSAGLQWWLKQGAGNDLGASKNTGWREVKSSEECIATLHPYKHLIYSWLCRICEEWRVFLKVALYSSNSAKLLRKMWGFWQKLLRKMWWIAENSLGKCDFSYVILWLWAFLVKEAKKYPSELSVPVSCHTSEMRIPRCWIFLSICSLFSERSWRQKARI